MYPRARQPRAASTISLARTSCRMAHGGRATCSGIYVQVERGVQSDSETRHRVGCPSRASLAGAPPTLQFLSGTCALGGGSFGSRLLHGCGNGGVLKEGFPPSARESLTASCARPGAILARVAISSCLWLMRTTVVDRALDSPAFLPPHRRPAGFAMSAPSRAP